jgi:hypothetical protein
MSRFLIAFRHPEVRARACAIATGCDIRERHNAVDPHNTGWQRDLSLSYERIGDVLLTQGEHDERRNPSAIRRATE